MAKYPEVKFHMAGMTSRGGSRGRPVRPQRGGSNEAMEASIRGKDIMDAEVHDAGQGQEDAEQYDAQGNEPEEEEMEKPKMVRQPDKPTAKQIAEHELTHMPFRSWCTHCIRGRARNDQHRRQKEGADDKDDCVTTWSMDYADFTNNVVGLEGETEREHSTVLVCHDSRTGGITADVVEQKGVGDGWIVNRINRDLEEFGYTGETVKVKTDQENAIVDLQREVMRTRAGLTIPVNSPVGESASNGRIENAIQRVEGLARTIRSDLETSLGFKVNKCNPLYTWMIRWAAELLTRQVRGENGKSAAEMIRGRESMRAMVKFGECVHYIPMKTAAKKEQQGKLEDRMKTGIFLGLRLRSDEVIIGTDEGVIKARTIRRRPPGEQWDRDLVLKMKGTPKRPDPKVDTFNIRASLATSSEGVQNEEHEQFNTSKAPIPVEPVPNVPREEQIRKMYITKKEVEKYGPTTRCPGCNTRGHGNRTHNQECRDRMKKAMEMDEQGRKRLRDDIARMDAHFEREVARRVELDPELKELQEKHQQQVEEIRKRKLELDEVNEAMRAMDKKKGRPRAEEGGETRANAKRKAEDVCEGDEFRGDGQGISSSSSGADIGMQIGSVDLDENEVGRKAVLMNVNISRGLDQRQERNQAYKEFVLMKPDVLVAEGELGSSVVRSFLAKLCEEQQRAGRGFMLNLKGSHEQKKDAEARVEYIMGRQGLVTKKVQGVQWLTNWHGIALASLSTTMLDMANKGWKIQKQMENRRHILIGTVGIDDVETKMQDLCKEVPPEEEDFTMYTAGDDLSGAQLDPKKGGGS